MKDPNPTLTIKWDAAISVGKLSLFFDTDYDQPMETVQMTHPEYKMPFCVEKYRIYDGTNQLIYEKNDNHQSINEIIFPEKLVTDDPSPTTMYGISEYTTVWRPLPAAYRPEW